jgi:UDP-N-acetylglucosamine/UDP-N-acetylgalactosamine diphosphorylase
MAIPAPPRDLLHAHGQGHLLRFWERLDLAERQGLLEEIAQIDFPLMARLIEQWVLNEPPAENFQNIKPVPVIPAEPVSAEARDAGEQALRDGRVGLFLVAGGQGTRLGFPGPKGMYPIGPVSKRTLFEFHADKIQNAQRRYNCRIPWYIMVSGTNEAATRRFFQEQDYFGLGAGNVKFVRQRMVPCVDAEGRFMLSAPGRVAMNPNGHGGCIPAMVETGVIADARERGVDILSYFQVDNWAIRLADPVFIGHHVLHGAEMSSKNHRKKEVREAVGVHCLCDGQYRVIEYSELDIYPQLLETGADGRIVHAAGNPAIHILSVDFVERVYRHFEDFPWHRAHKKIPYINEDGALVEPGKPNAYKFETFIFDALRFVRHAPVCLEIMPAGEYTPIKQYEGANSVVAAWSAMREYWAGWFEAVGCNVPRNSDGKVAIPIEISPKFAFSKEEFVQKMSGRAIKFTDFIAIGPDGELEEKTPANLTN